MSNIASVKSSAKAVETGRIHARSDSGSVPGCVISMPSSFMPSSCHGGISEVRQLLEVGLGGGEEISDVSDALDDRPDGPAVGPEVRVVELVPGDRRGYRRARRGPHRIGGNQCLDARVLRVIEPRPTLARALRPLPGDQLRHGRTDGARDLLDPGARVGEVVARHDRDPDLDAALAGRLGIAADADVVKRGPIEPGQDERLVPGRRIAGVDVDVGEGRAPRIRKPAGPGVDLEARLVAEPHEGRDAVSDQVVVRLAVLPLLEPGLVPACQPGRGGRGDVLLPEALARGAIRIAMEVERPVCEVREHGRRDPGEVTDELALRDRRVAIEDDLVEGRQLDVVFADLPDAFVAEGVQGRELGVRGLPGVCVARRGGGAVAFRALRGHFVLRWWRCGFGLPDGRGECDRSLATHCGRITVALDALESRLANHAVARPATELGADDELWPDPGHSAEVAAPAPAVVLGRGRVEWRIVDLEGPQRVEHRPAGRAGEPPPHPSTEPELAVLVDADDERAEVPGVATPRGPAADHELLFRPDLDLQPGAGTAARLVARPLELGDDAFEILLLGGRSERLALTIDVRRETDTRVGAKDALEQALAVLEGDVEEHPAVEVEQVERLVDEVRCPFTPVRSWRRPKSGWPASSSATTSPSTIAWRASIQVGGRSRPGK